MGPCLTDAAARLLPTVWFVNWPLRRGPNAAAAIIAAKVSPGHGTSTFRTHEPYAESP